MPTRTSFLAGAVAALTAPSPAPFAALERRGGGRLGVFALDLRDGTRVAYRAAERFPLASTFKVPLVMATLARLDRGRERLERPVAFTASDILPFSPDLAAHPHGGALTVAQLCAAAIERSDNGAANLLLRACGGPRTVTAYLRSLGDRVTRLDRYEPALNTATAGDPRDTTTPQAIGGVLLHLATRPVLSHASTVRLVQWMRAATTGLRRIRAGVPRGWEVADKTGTTDTGSNDVAILFPPSGAEIVVALYLAESHAPQATQDGTLAAAARLVVQTLRG